MFIQILITALAATATATNPYKLVDSHSGTTFFDSFDFFTDADPTHGAVQYIPRAQAAPSKLIGVVMNSDNSTPSAYLGVDSTTVTSNRPSVRLTSKKSYNHALVIADIKHMPSACGIWPAYWMVGTSWPSNGEIDIIEQVNGHDFNTATLHTSANCAITGSDIYSGTLQTPDCDVNAPNQSKNAGCGIRALSNETYTIGNQSCVHATAGDAFNAQSGGVYATLWTSAGVSVYFFPREYIPADIASNNPDPTTWTSKPQAVFSGNGCNFDSHLKDLSIVINTDFCGDWAGNTWEADGCAAKTGVKTCDDYVMNNPKAFENAYWLFNSIKVYQNETTTSAGY